MNADTVFPAGGVSRKVRGQATGTVDNVTHDPWRGEDPAMTGSRQPQDLQATLSRIGESLDLAAVLQEVVTCACELAGAEQGFVATVDDGGRAVDVATAGLDETARRRITDWSDGPRFHARLRDRPGPLRVADPVAGLRDLGIDANALPARALLSLALRHHGTHLATLCLFASAGRRGFAEGAEERLASFAASAAGAIANAVLFRDERRARASLEALVETSPVGVLVFDGATGRPVSINGEARRMLARLRMPGVPLDGLLGVVRCRFAGRAEVALQDCPISRALGMAEAMRGEELEISVPDGRSVRALVNITPIAADDGAVLSVVATMQDLAPLDELERQRTEFLDMVSHELRAPLTSIKGSAATLVETADTLDRAEMRAFLRIIADQADHMRGLIGDLLDLGRMETGRLSVSPEPSELAVLVDRARSTFMSGGARHDVVIDLAPDLPAVMADRRRIVQVLNNLLSNAARHTSESSSIRVEATLDGSRVVVSVRDRGRGIAPERLPLLFRKYATDDGDGQRRPGNGIGLAICKGLVEAHGGRIRAESDGPGQGARFTFTLAVCERPVGEGMLHAPRPDAPRRSGGRPRILVLDDDPQTLRFVRDTLAEAGYDPLVTGDPFELPGLLETASPDLVLLDLLLPDTDGIELMQRLPRLSGLPVIFISAYGRDETVARALEAGAADYIVKPFSPTELTARIAAALRGRAAPEPFALGDLSIHYQERRVSVAGRPVDLTATEFALLRALAMAAGQVVTYPALTSQVWDEPDSSDTRRLRAFVKRLRRKLGDDPARPAYIVNHRGVGYRMPLPG